MLTLITILVQWLYSVILQNTNGTNSLAVKAAFTFPSPSPREQLPAVLQRKGVFVRNKNFKLL